jgi:hypothetical protein
MDKSLTIGIDAAKQVFYLHGQKTESACAFSESLD